MKCWSVNKRNFKACYVTCLRVRPISNRPFVSERGRKVRLVNFHTIKYSLFLQSNPREIITIVPTMK